MTLPQIVPIDHAVKEDVLFIDFSTYSTYSMCKEKDRLAHILHLRPVIEEKPLSYGHAIHAGIAELRRKGDIDAAVQAYVQDLIDAGSSLPISIEDDERRSVERGEALIRAYAQRWHGEPYEVYRGSDGEPYCEIGFAMYFMDWHGRPVMLAGRMDWIARSTIDQRAYQFDLKTTTSNVPQQLKQVRPNHQFTIYTLAAKTILSLDLAGSYMDVVYISDRKPAVKGGPWMQLGVDIDKDFGRQPTHRSATDIDEMMFDLIETTRERLTWQDRLESGEISRWPRNAPGACFQYGGCRYLDICSTNCNPNIIATNYVIKPWLPWQELVKKEV